MLNGTFLSLYHMRINPLTNLHTPCYTTLKNNNLSISRNRFYSRINKTLTTRHRVEEELRRRQSSDERVLNEPARLCAVIVLLKMRESAVLKAIRDTLALNVLLANTRNHLRDVNRPTL